MDCVQCSSTSPDVEPEMTINRKRKALEAAINSCSKAKFVMVDSKKSTSSKWQKQEAQGDEIPTDVRQVARRMLLEEVRRAAVRAEQIGPQGWKRPPCLRTNKTFLTRALKSTLPRRGRSPVATNSKI